MSPITELAERYAQAQLDMLVEHSQWCHRCISAALKRHEHGAPAPYEDPLATAAVWMVARHETLTELARI
jgi:hypothetical protein